MKENAMAATQYMNSDVESFVYMAAHDLRSPLMSVKGLISLMRLDSEKENLPSYFDLLERNVERMNQAISDIITHSKNGIEKIEIEVVDFKDILDEAISYLQYMKGAESVCVKLFAEYGESFYSNRKKLLSIFCNLISNAIRYRDQSKNAFLRIHVMFSSEGCQVVFEDNGIGIAEDIQAKVFEKYFLVTPDHGGSGIGLFVVKESVEKLGGNIQLRSKLGQGTTFIVHVPNLALRNGNV